MLLCIVSCGGLSLSDTVGIAICGAVAKTCGKQRGEHVEVCLRSGCASLTELTHCDPLTHRDPPSSDAPAPMSHSGLESLHDLL